MQYNATVVLDTTATDEATTDHILHRLGPTGARLYPAISWDDQGRMNVTVTVAAITWAEATQTAVDLVSTVANSTACSVELMTTAEFDARNQRLAAST